ncbi:MAG: DUF6259 domain-containing protein [Armatimonadota bacterium]
MPHLVTCRTLTLQLDDAGRAVSLRHRESGYDFFSTPAPPVGLWQMGLIRPVRYDDPLPEIEIPDVPYQGHETWANRNEYQADLELDSDHAPAPQLSGDGSDLLLVWNVPVPGGTAVLRLHILGGDRVGLEFRCHVSLPSDWAVKRVTYPRLRGFGDVQAPGDDALLYPENWGVLRANPLEDMTAYNGQYPSGLQWTQMCAWLHGQAGMYLAVRDPDTHHTGIDMQYVEDDAAAPWEIVHWYMSHVGKPPKAERIPLADRLAAGVQPSMQARVNHWPAMTAEWECPYPVVLQGFTGSWYDAARIHREWATQQRWCRRGRLCERTDTSGTLASTDLWFIRYGFHPGSLEPKPAWEFQQAMHTLHDYFDMPFGVHWYNWHDFSWHRNYPSHAPVVEGFSEVLKDLQERGIVIMPYCQGRILYRDRRTFPAERTHASVEANGQPYLERYTPQDDWPLALCPGDAWSRMQWYEAARMLWREYGVEGVYFDQIAAMMPSLCYHAGHGHLLGGGTYYWEGYDRALAEMAPMIAEKTDRFLSSELLAEAYMDRLDLYLCFVPPLEDYVPLHAAIYAGYTTLMGRSTPSNILEDPQLFAICQGEQLLFGGQLGWMNEEILKYPQSAAYLKELAQLRGKVRDFLHYGSLEAPLEMEQSAQLVIDLPAVLCSKPEPVHVCRDAIRHTVWRAPDDRLLLLLLNESTEEASVSFTPPTDWPRGEWALLKMGSEDAEEMPMSGRMTITLPPLAVVALISGA